MTIIPLLLTHTPARAERFFYNYNRAVRRRLATFQSAQVADLVVYFGKTFPAPRSGSAPAVVIRDPAAIRRWKLAMATSMYRVDVGWASPGSGPRWDSVTFELKDGQRIPYLLYGPYEVSERWGKEVYRLYRAAVDVAKWGPSGRPHP